MISRLLKRLPTTVRSPRQTSTDSVSLNQWSGRRALACGLPALLFSVVVANPCEAIQVGDFASPAATPITRPTAPAPKAAPAADLATAVAPKQEPARYAPPVHVTPPAQYIARPTQTVRSESVNGIRNTTRLLTYPDQARVTKLSDETLGSYDQPPVHRQAPAPPQNFGSQQAAAAHYNGLHGYRTAPASTVEPRQHGKIRRPGLQDHIAGAFERMSNRGKTEPTEAVRYEEEIYYDVEPIAVNEPAGAVGTVGYSQAKRVGTARASGANRNRRLAAKQSRENALPQYAEPEYAQLQNDQPEFIQSETDQPARFEDCLLYTSPSPRDRTRSRMPSSA